MMISDTAASRVAAAYFVQATKTVSKNNGRDEKGIRSKIGPAFLLSLTYTGESYEASEDDFDRDPR